MFHSMMIYVKHASKRCRKECSAVGSVSEQMQEPRV